MPWRYYPHTFHQDDKVYHVLEKKWIKSNRPYRPQKRGIASRKQIWSSRFGFIDQYSRKEREYLKCPSGYSLGQAFGALRKLWLGYYCANTKNDIEKMKKYAKAIQNVQDDMGVATASFPHLGLYGDNFYLNDKHGNRIVFQDHSELKKKQKEYEKWQDEQAKDSQKIQEELQKPDKEKGEELETFADDVSPADVNLYDDDELVPNLLEPDSEKGEEIITMTDDVPFMNFKKRVV